MAVAVCCLSDASKTIVTLSRGCGEELGYFSHITIVGTEGLPGRVVVYRVGKCG